MKPTTEQWAILDAVANTPSNLIINALAGTGKTSTLRLIERATKTQPVLYLVFNKRNADESRFDPEADKDAAAERMLPTTIVKTINACGYSVWMNTASGKVTVDRDKIRKLFAQVVNDLPKSRRNAAWDEYGSVISAVALAKAYGYIPDGMARTEARLCDATELSAHLDEAPSSLAWTLIDTTLRWSIKTAYAGSVDFNDQIYMPALFGGSFPRFPLVMIDEYQDLNPVNHHIVDKLLKSSRGIGVGDPWQSIYGFRGAKQDGMAYAKERFDMHPLDLSVSFRCPRAVVEAARWRVPHFKWLKDGGHVEVLSTLGALDIPDGAAILCRNNAPLFRTAIRLLSNGRSVSVGGSEIGPRLINLMKKLGPDSSNRLQTLDLIEQWRLERLAKESKTANDLADCMIVFAEKASTLGGAIATAEHILAQTGTIQLMTGHKAKGLEFDIVYHLDPWLCRDDEQDQNLRYVITTRAKDTLFEINSETIQW